MDMFRAQIGQVHLSLTNLFNKTLKFYLGCCLLHLFWKHFPELHTSNHGTFQILFIFLPFAFFEMYLTITSRIDSWPSKG